VLTYTPSPTLIPTLSLTLTLTLSLTLNPNPTNPKLQARIPAGPHFTICLRDSLLGLSFDNIMTRVGWRCGVAVASFIASSPVNTGIVVSGLTSHQGQLSLAPFLRW